MDVLGVEKTKIAVAGHICIDLIPQFPDVYSPMALEPGKLIPVNNMYFYTGGAVLNTGLALHKLGTEVRLFGKVGNDELGQLLLQLLNKIDSTVAQDIIVDHNQSSSYTLVISTPGSDRIFLHNSGANNNFQATDVLNRKLDDVQFFHFGYPPIMKRMYQNDGEELELLMSSIKSKGINTSLDMAMPDIEARTVNWENILSKVLPNVDFFIPSFEEIDMLLNQGSVTGQVSINRVRNIADKLLNYGCRVVIIKLGDLGLYMKSLNRNDAPEDNLKAWYKRELFVPCFKTEVKGTTGAGDCSIAGLITAFTKGFAPKKALNIAAALGAASVESIDATGAIVEYEKVSKRIEEGWERGTVSILNNLWIWDDEGQVWIGPHDQEYSERIGKGDLNESFSNWMPS